MMSHTLRLKLAQWATLNDGVWKRRCEEDVNDLMVHKTSLSLFSGLWFSFPLSSLPFTPAPLLYGSVKLSTQHVIICRQNSYKLAEIPPPPLELFHASSRSVIKPPPHTRNPPLYHKINYNHQVKHDRAVKEREWGAYLFVISQMISSSSLCHPHTSKTFSRLIQKGNVLVCEGKFSLFVASFFICFRPMFCYIFV